MYVIKEGGDFLKSRMLAKKNLTMTSMKNIEIFYNEYGKYIPTTYRPL